MLHSLIVIAKTPQAGRVKTRLCPPLSFQQAADVAAAALADTLDVTSSVPARRHVLALDGPPWAALAPQWSVVPQPTGGLDVRLVAAFAAAGPGTALLVGMDTPHLNPAQLTAFDAEKYDACLGLAADGGYWAIGFRAPELHADVIAGVPMSTDHTGADQVAAMLARGLRVQLLERLVDVDTFADALVIAAQFPHTAFARSVDSVACQLVS
jgi:glycosyltransferase A (GT-A) superfamily protein (DUF2064 family)